VIKKYLAIVTMFTICALAFAGCKADTTKTNTVVEKTPIKIGAVLSVTGANAPLGDPEKKALEMEVDKLNTAGGVNGAKIDLIIEDDESDAAKAVAALNKLIKVDKVTAIIGGTGTTPTMAMKPISAKEKIPQIALVAGNQVTKGDYKWIFRTAHNETYVFEKAIDYLSKTVKVKKLAILHDSNAYGQGGADTIKAIAPGKGMTIVATEKYDSTATDVTTQLTTIKAANPDCLIIWGTNPVPAVAVKNMKQLGMNIPVLGSQGIANAKFIELAGDAANGVVFPAGYILVPSAVPANSPQKPIIDTFVKEYKAKYGAAPNSFAGHAWDAFHILMKAIEKGGSDKAKIRTEIEKVKGFAGVDGIFDYSATNHDGLDTNDLVIIKIENGKWTLGAK
jgi:branched-chain amino acid transport system substrate-binding protein